MAGIILYDIPSRGGFCWTPNPWKARMALNFKGVPYTTTWLEYPDIAGALQEKGVAPNASGTPYTAPAAQFEDGTIVMDSLRIARELERRHPEPSLVVDDAVVEQALTVMNNIFGACVAELLPPVPRAFLSDVSAEYFETSREKAFGMTLAELQKAKGGQQAWDAATPFIQEMAALLRKKGDGPFYLGNTVSFADFVTASMSEFMKRLGPDYYHKWVAVDEVIKRHHEACGKWLEKDR